MDIIIFDWNSESWKGLKYGSLEEIKIKTGFLKWILNCRYIDNIEIQDSGLEGRQFRTVDFAKLETYYKKVKFEIES